MDISEIIVDNINNYEDSEPGLTGGGIKTLIDDCQSLLIKRQNENDVIEESRGFTENMLNTMSVIVGLEVGWNEINEEDTRLEMLELVEINQLIPITIKIN